MNQLKTRDATQMREYMNIGKQKVRTQIETLRALRPDRSG
jgi:hypothetical protein